MDLRVAAEKEMIRIALWHDILAAITEEAPKGIAADIQNLKMYMVDPESPLYAQKAGQIIKQPGSIPANHPAFYLAAQYAKDNPDKFYIFSKLTPMLSFMLVRDMLHELVNPSLKNLEQQSGPETSAAQKSLKENRELPLSTSDILSATKVLKTGQPVPTANKGVIEPVAFSVLAQRAMYGRGREMNADSSALDEINKNVLIVTPDLQQYTDNLNLALDGIRIGEAVKRGPQRYEPITEEQKEGIPGAEITKRPPPRIQPWTGGRQELLDQGSIRTAFDQNDYMMKEAVQKIMMRMNVVNAYLDSLE